MNIKRNTIELGDLCLEVIHKDIKNVHLSVHPPMGRVTISAPLRMELENIRLFSISKLGWIRKQQVKIKNQKREAPREYVNRESHYYLGQRYLLKVVEENTTPKVVLKHTTIEIHVRSGSTMKQKEALLQRWYREQLKKLALQLIIKFEKMMNVKVSEVFIRTMKTKWGTCNPRVKRIWLNTELAKKPLECIEYIAVHEMVHLLERKHNDNFIGYMNKYLPRWKYLKEKLNRLPINHANWGY